MQRRGLFGGAIEVALPSDYQDVSDFRQIPDHQEVFTSPGPQDISVVFEIVELQRTVANDAAAEYFWNDLAECNAAERRSIRSQSALPKERLGVTHSTQRSFAAVVEGDQVILKERMRQSVQVHLGIVRLFDVDSELLISLNAPLQDRGSSIIVGSVPSQPSAAEASTLFMSIMESIVIKDWSLFG